MPSLGSYIGVSFSGLPASEAIPPLTAIAANGWEATYDGTPPTFDPVGDPQTFNVRRSGYSASGASTTVTDVITMMSRVRQVYPNQANLTADSVALSEFIYSSDTVTGVTNNSTRAYPKPIAMWLNRDLEVIESNSHVVRLAVAHAYARSGRPVAAVKFTASDGTNTAEVTVSSLTYVSYTASGLGAPVYEGTLDVSGLTQGATITIDAVIYPWVGSSFTISTDADTYPSPNLTTLRAYNNRTLGTAYYYAYVDPADASGGTASTNPATAAADPFQTLALAAAAIKTAKGGTNTDLGIIRLVAADHTFSSISASNTATWPLIIEASNSANKSTTKLIAAAGASTTTSIPDHVVFRNITICRGSASDHIMLDQNSAANTYTDLCAFESCAFSLNGFDTYAGFVYRTARTVFNNCDGDNVGQALIVGTVNKTATVLGCSSGYLSGQTAYSAIASKTDGFSVITSSAARPAAVGVVFGWNYFSYSGASIMCDAPYEIGVRGLAVVGNIIESWGTSTNVALKISADSANVNVQNVVCQGNTVVGERMNALYLETVTDYDKSGYFHHNVVHKGNIKSDVFATQTVDGNWPARYKVSWKRNAYLRGSNSGNTPAAANWIGDIWGIGEVGGTDASPLTTNFVNDNSNTGSDDGNGDYTPGGTNSLPTLPAGTTQYSHDLYGTAIATDGTALAGAVQI